MKEFLGSDLKQLASRLPRGAFLPEDSMNWPVVKWWPSHNIEARIWRTYDTYRFSVRFEGVRMAGDAHVCECLLQAMALAEAEIQNLLTTPPKQEAFHGEDQREAQPEAAHRVV